MSKMDNLAECLTNSSHTPNSQNLPMIFFKTWTLAIADADVSANEYLFLILQRGKLLFILAPIQCGLDKLVTCNL